LRKKCGPQGLRISQEAEQWRVLKNAWRRTVSSIHLRLEKADHRVGRIRRNVLLAVKRDGHLKQTLNRGNSSPRWLGKEGDPSRNNGKQFPGRGRSFYYEISTRRNSGLTKTWKIQRRAKAGDGEGIYGKRRQRKKEGGFPR